MAESLWLPGKPPETFTAFQDAPHRLRDWLVGHPGRAPVRLWGVPGKQTVAGSHARTCAPERQAWLAVGVVSWAPGSCRNEQFGNDRPALRQKEKASPLLLSKGNV